MRSGFWWPQGTVGFGQLPRDLPVGQVKPQLLAHAEQNGSTAPRVRGLSGEGVLRHATATCGGPKRGGGLSSPTYCWFLSETSSFAPGRKRFARNPQRSARPRTNSFLKAARHSPLHGCVRLHSRISKKTRGQLVRLVVRERGSRVVAVKYCKGMARPCARCATTPWPMRALETKARGVSEEIPNGLRRPLPCVGLLTCSARGPASPGDLSE